MPKKQSRTVDLRFSADEVEALYHGALYLEIMDALPASADEAFVRIIAAHKRRSGTISKVPRDSLRSLADAIRPRLPDVRATPGGGTIADSFTTLDARLSRQRGRPVKSLNLSLWRQRAADVRRVKRELRQRLGYATDDAAAAALGVPRGTVGTWRQRHPNLFDAPESD